MADVDTNSTDSVNINIKMNGINGTCDVDEPMDVDSRDDSQAESQEESQDSCSEVSLKKSEISDIPSKKYIDNSSVDDQENQSSSIPESNAIAEKSTDLVNSARSVDDEDSCTQDDDKELPEEMDTADGGDDGGGDGDRDEGDIDEGDRNDGDRDEGDRDEGDREDESSRSVKNDCEQSSEENSNQSSAGIVTKTVVENGQNNVDSETKPSQDERRTSTDQEKLAVPVKEDEVDKVSENNTKHESPVEEKLDQPTDESSKSKEEVVESAIDLAITKEKSPARDVNGSSVNVEENDNDVEHVPIVQEVHSISDSDDEEEVKSVETSVKSGPSAKPNGHNDRVDDDDAPVSINSDSEPELVEPSKNGKSSEVHEILSDKEDCVLVEDDKDDKKDDSETISPRRSTRARKSVVKVRDFSAFDDDIEEVLEDPLMQPAAKKQKTSPGPPPLGITIQDARSLATDPLLTSNSSFSNQFHSTPLPKKEPTLVIIDTNQIMQRGPSALPGLTGNQNFSVHPVGVPAQGVYPTNLRGASITPIMQKSPQITKPPPPLGLNNQITVPLLPALTDDMFVLEAPSFIVPYIYEKPPSENLKEIVEKVGKELEEQRKKEGENVAEAKEDDPTASATGTDSKGDGSDATAAASAGSDKKKKKKKRGKDGDDSWDESDTSTDDEASDSEQRTKVLIKDVKENINDVLKPISAESLKDSGGQTSGKKDNYFESPLGLFFMDIGINLVQEHVQTDLLRQQKKKMTREGETAVPSIQQAINSLMKNLELSKKKNNGFKFETKRCEYCNFKSESALAMAHHYETPHMNNHQYRCNFCTFETRPPYDILFHMEAVHNIKARLEKAPSYHQCPNCPFEDNGRSKLARHSVICTKKFRPELNLNPPLDWEPPAKIPRIKPRHGLVGTATAYQAMAAQAQRAASAGNVIQRPNVAVNAAMMRGRGRPQTVTKTSPAGTVLRTNPVAIRPQIPGMVLPNNFQLSAPGQFNQNPGPKSSKTQQPSISITPLPRHGITNTSSMQTSSAMASAKPPGAGNMKPGQTVSSGKTAFVICEICDGYIKDLDQLRNHMQWMHKVKIHPKMIYNRPPLNCQKCQFRFFTDQGLERHLLGSHGLVTSSMQEAANKGKDAGRCPVCGRMYQWKLLNHVSRDHNMTLKPAHLSYKCTVCTATFGMYKQFENHVYSAHSTVAKKAMDNKKGAPVPSGSKSSGDSLLKPLKINDEITIIPQPASRQSRGPMEIESHVID